MTLKISFKIEAVDNSLMAFKRLENHIEELLDVDSWPEIITVYDVKVKEQENK